MAKILIIEDEDEVRSNLRILLKMYKHKVIEADNGKDGLEAAFDEQPDLILCDINMPGMDGLEVLERLQSNPETFTTPFLFLTAYADRLKIREGMELGADDYITKPFTSNELINAVETRLKKSIIQQVKANQKIDNLRKNISLAIPHELRTPLNSILGFSRLLIDDHKDFDEAELISMYENIHDSGKRLLRIINNYIYYNTLMTMESSEIRKNVSLYDIRPVIDEIVNEFYFKYDISKLKINLDELLVDTNEEQLRKALFELIDNSCKFSVGDDPIEITGIHIENKYLLRFTNPVPGKVKINLDEVGAFTQIGRDFYEQQGAGLGLAIIKQVAELNKMGMNIISEEERFTIELIFHVK